DGARPHHRRRLTEATDQRHRQVLANARRLEGLARLGHVPRLPQVHPVEVTSSPDQGSVLGAVVLEGLAFMALRRMPAGANHAPPGHVAAAVRHHLAHRAGSARTDRRGDVAVGHDLPGRDGLDDAEHALEKVVRCVHQSSSAPIFSPYWVSSTTVKPTRLKNSSGLSSPGSQMTVSLVKPRLRASSAVDLTTNFPTPLPCASAETFIRQMQLRNSSSSASASKFAMMKASTSPSLSTTTRDQLLA